MILLKNLIKFPEDEYHHTAIALGAGIMGITISTAASSAATKDCEMSLPTVSPERKSL